ncbi:MAG TPA: DUF6328 family protein [Chloroflexota bacterium]|nr:DUF6328 family protein [Chloroflexota bacterium]
MRDQVDTALNEARTLVLVVHILVGFGLEAPFGQRFPSLPWSSQEAKLAGLALQLVALALLLWPCAYHRIVLRAEDVPELKQFVTGVLGLALMPFAIGVAIELYVAAAAIVGNPAGLAIGLGGAVAALACWYGLPELDRRRDPRPEPQEDNEMPEPTDVQTKVKNVLTELRVVIPGAQALLGFQLAGVLTDAFDKLPAVSKEVHLASLVLLALAVLLMMTPPAYHRIAERGEDTVHFERFASRVMLISMVPLAFGIAGDVYVVYAKVTGSATAGAVAGALLLVGFLGMWFGYTWFRRLTGAAPARCRDEPSRREARAA